MRKSKNKVIALAMAATMVVGNISSYSVFADNTSKEYTVNMNVTYKDFYSMFGVDTMENITSTTYTDAVSSATKSKPYNTGKNPVAYVTGDPNNDEVVYIKGVKIPVQVSEEDRQSLISAGSYKEEDFTEVTEDTTSFFKAKINIPEKVVASEAVTKEAVTISESYGNATALSDVNAGYTTMSKYGDYEFALSGEDITNVISKTTPYGVIVNTLEGDKYALYSQENIWKVNDLAWSVGVVTSTHGCKLRTEPYVKSIGQTVTSFTYITNAGLYTVDIKDTKLADVLATKDTTVVATAGELGENTDVNVEFKNLPNDYQPTFTYKAGGKGAVEKTVEGTTKNENGTYTVKVKDILPGNYNIVLSDGGNNYSSKSASFSVKGSPVEIKEAAFVLSPAKGKDTIENYVGSITKISVALNGGQYVEYVLNKTGMGTIKVANIVNADGTINKDATYTEYETEGSGKTVKYNEKSTGKVFAEGINAVTVTANNYDDVTGSIEIKPEHVHAFGDSEITKAATCVAKGIKTYTCECGETQIEEVDVDSENHAGNTVIKNKKAATYKAAGYTGDKYCADCGKKILSGKSIAKLKAKTQKITVKKAKATYKATAIAKKSVKFTIGAQAKGRLTYKTSSKNVLVSSKGIVTVKKGCKKGTYKITVTAKATANGEYKLATKVITVIVK